MGKTEKFDFTGEMVKLLPVILREVTRRQETVFTKGNLAVSHIIVLDYLKERGPCKMSELAKALGLTLSAVTSIVDKMIDSDLVKRERSQKDRRVVKVQLLAKGQKSATLVTEARYRITDDIYSVLSGAEKITFLKMIRKVHDNLRKKNEE